MASALVTRSSGLKALEVGLQFVAQQVPNLDAFVDGGSITEDRKMHDQFVLARTDPGFRNRSFGHKYSGEVNPIQSVSDPYPGQVILLAVGLPHSNGKSGSICCIEHHQDTPGLRLKKVVVDGIGGSDADERVEYQARTKCLPEQL